MVKINKDRKIKDRGKIQSPFDRNKLLMFTTLVQL